MKTINDKLIVTASVAFLAATAVAILLTVYELIPRYWQAYKDYQYYNIQPPPLEATEPGCYRSGAYSCTNERYEGYLAGYDPITHSQIIKWPGADCLTRYALCVHVGDACGWKPNPVAAKCWAGGMAEGNPFRFTQADCDNLSTRCKNDSKRDECIKKYKYYCNRININIKK